ncbi:TetR family transcriptional regulator [Promicromonospora iranensis]|uniref:AcrR family transcriptional regulator n=1 Tax=Promicromonospora iranensis TaxID=1105144 RepID=A0ABU2CM62_9MICO|nr:TetR family transcriptional regulator [Promicromonospora iranensis]MDR7382425.1 AcrR family transcriptional regulator [Promicromonospora iranensis]
MADRKPLTARGAATWHRILEAATAEFAQYGFSGARIERITSAARTNKAQLYGYFGTKDELFDAVLAASFRQIIDLATIDADDLPGWAVRLYDEYLAHPDIVRLATWSRLERRPEGHLVADPERQDAEKLAAIASAQAAGTVVAGDPFDVMAMVIAMSMAWSPVSNVYAAHSGEAPAEHRRRREFLREAVRRAVTPD